MNNFELVNTINMLDMYSEKKVPQKISYAITRNLSLLQKDYDCYITSLNKLYSGYEEYVVKDEENKIMYNEKGIPIIEDKEKSKELMEEITSLLSIEIETNIYHIPESVFDYEDDSGRYDALSAKDIMILQSILCEYENTDIDVKNDESGE